MLDNILIKRYNVIRKRERGKEKDLKEILEIGTKAWEPTKKGSNQNEKAA